MMRHQKLLSLAAFIAVLSSADLARAEAVCGPSASLGKACKTAGPNANQPGICEATPCDAGAQSDEQCSACVVDGTAGGCGGGRAVDSKASFTPTVGGCCSVAGTHSWEAGAGLVLGTALLGLALVKRRRTIRR
jgi:hypothetical protein